MEQRGIKRHTSAEMDQLAKQDFVDLSKSEDTKEEDIPGGMYATEQELEESKQMEESGMVALKPENNGPLDPRAQLKKMKMKQSSRRVILPAKDKKQTPQCLDCKGFYHIQPDPISAYDGVGIVCDACGKNRNDNPEMVTEAHYYKCEQCENVDICSKCYKQEQKKLMDKASKASSFAE